MTHYVMAFTVKRRQLFQTACGEMVTMARHSSEPDCPVCQAWLEKDAQETQETAAALSAEFPDLASKLASLIY